ncbi:MAG: DUF3373 domain-containing protein, partial [bacterium]|nr:DUF3373 domain-containing protein [bacterium]
FIALVLIAGGSAFAVDEVTQEEVQKLKQDIKDLEKRVMKNERKTGVDRLNFSGDFRFQMHSLESTFNDSFDGMHLQRMMVDNLFYVGANEGSFPPNQEAVQQYIAQNYSNYLYYLNNVVTFDWLKQMVGSFPPEQMQQFMGMLLPHTYQPGYDYKNSIIYTNRLRLQMDAKVSKNVDFAGRLSMYKVWGDSTGVQVFNGQPTSINVDGTTASVPNSDIVRVDRAYFTWKSPKYYLSIGRRPSTGGVPLNFREDEPRGGTPLGSIINYQFDGATLGWHINDYSTLRLCYGVGFESGFGNGAEQQLPQDRLKDASFLGVNWDIWNTDDMFIQGTFARAFDVTDGFNGLVVLPVDPVSGQEIPGTPVLRYTPSANLGNIDWASIVLVRHDGPFDWFATYSYMQSDPNNITTPFGGLFSDPFETPQKQDGNMIYLGARYNFPNEATKIGIEYNKGSEYWFNMAVAEDDLFAPKTSVRGSVWELYLTHRISKRFVFKADYIRYDFTDSGSGWHMGAPKDLDSTPILGFASPTSADKYMLSFSARF